ncbi:MAG TPA: 6-phosphogluconolactonase [Nevskiaceae bacterium]
MTAVGPASPRLHRSKDPAALYRGATAAFLEVARSAIRARGRFCVALAGGETPRPLYQRLAAAEPDAVDWAKVEICFGDERCVPPEHARSNYGMVRAALLPELPPARIHRVRGEEQPQRAARLYASELAVLFAHQRPPRFDLILLGLGGDGHTASLFPGTAALRERRRAVVAQYVEVQREWRVTLTLPVIDAARAVWVLAVGAGKAAIVRRVLAGARQPEVLPMQAVAPEVGVDWWLDAAAAADLPAGFSPDS